jgi:phage terminase large subunit-like protein
MAANLRQIREKLIRIREERVRRFKNNQLLHYRPYAKQREFHAAGAKFRERLLTAGNQLGKTLSAAAEVAMHATGIYPDWWDGARFERPTRGIVGSESAELTRNGAQKMLVGPPERESEWGTGMIPCAHLIDWTRRMGVSNALDTVMVRHVSGGTSTILFKSYDQGRTKWQADTVDYAWLDEEPPDDIYTEALTRTNTTQGPMLLTFTPLKGLSSVVMRFLQPDPADLGARNRTVTKMTIYDAEHYTDAEREAIINSYPPHERQARAMGEPLLGSGRAFPISEDRVKYNAGEYHPFPNWFAHICGMDFGWDHPTAAAWVAWDRDRDVVYVYDAYRQREATPIVHAAAIRGRGEWIPVAWPHDGLQHDKGSGEQLAEQYKKLGLKMLDKRATFQDGTNGVEAGVAEMLVRMETGRLRVASHLVEFWEEFRMYHRENGKLVKVNDDIISAIRYALMMLRFATPPGRQTESFEPGRPLANSADNQSFEP